MTLKTTTRWRIGDNYRTVLEVYFDGTSVFIDAGSDPIAFHKDFAADLVEAIRLAAENCAEDIPF